MEILYGGFDLNSFWEECEYAEKEYVCEPLTDQLVEEIEIELGYKLPPSYIELMKTQNGGSPNNTAVPCNEPTSWSDDHVAITSIYGISKNKSWSLCGELGNQFMIDEWEYPEIGVYICNCPSAGHDMVALDYRKCGNNGEPEVVHVDQESDYKITFLASNLESFIKSLKHDDYYG
ncbi:SMI1/KNR4 family protein [Pseudoalteromonas sp. NEC-BIFX-2020_002]|nr:SMI1/KNR4 family protein [Pseudoalteromonas sp. NEC-BIFX-2020_002]